MKDSSTTLTYRAQVEDLDGPIGVMRDIEMPVEVVLIEHGSFGIRAVRVRELNAPSTRRPLCWTLHGDELEDLVVEAVPA